MDTPETALELEASSLSSSSPTPSPSTSPSSSFSSKDNEMYDVFLSFKADDTRKTFTDHLYCALKDRRIDVFIAEDEAGAGELITDELMQVIERSRIAVVIFSKGYADSTWCLDELVKIMECRTTLEQIVLPIFYDVDPTDVGNQTGCFAQALQKHEVEHKEEKVQSWRNALTEATNMTGHVLRKIDGYEGMFIRKIVDEIIGKLKSICVDTATKQVAIDSKMQISSYADVLVGIDSRVQEISAFLDVGGSNDVRIIGICGMGGIGKTTIAKAIFNKYHHSFDGKSFIPDLREKKLVDVQEQLLSDILKLTMVEVSCMAEGIHKIKKRLRTMKVLVILDDINRMDQLEALAIERDSFGAGSRIIITTRDKHLLQILGVSMIYYPHAMNEDEALHLLSWHAFKNPSPDEGYLGLLREAVDYCGGLPLALKVLGSSLCMRSTSEWRSVLDKFKNHRPWKIYETLKISYDGLTDNVKAIFLDICCFFVGMNKDYVMQILDGCGFSAGIGMTELLERSLLTVAEENKLMMHDLVRDMGREIVRSESDIPGKCSRLWHIEDVDHVLRNNSGTEKIEGLTFDLKESCELNFSTEAFRQMQRLRLLKLNYVKLTGSYKLLSTELRWLCWHGFPLEVIPEDFNQPNLVAIDLSYSKLRRVWEDSNPLLEKLKFLNLSHSHYLTRSPDFSKLPNLEQLILEGCNCLFDVDQSIGQLERLVLVNLKNCKALRDLPRSFYKLKSIETLILTGCSKFEKLANELGEMVSLTTLFADNTAIKELPSSLVQLKNLNCLALFCVKWSPSTNIFTPWYGLNTLVKLDLSGCNLTDDAIPKGLESLVSLKELDLQNNGFHSLPSLSGLLELEVLCLNDCKNLIAIPNLPISLKVLRVMNCMSLGKMPDFSEMSNMRELYLSDLFKLTEIPGFSKSLSSMTGIHMTRCPNLTTVFRTSILQLLEKLKFLNLSHSDYLTRSPNFSKLPNLEQLILEDCEYLFDVDQSIGQLERLLLVNLKDCKVLKELPWSFYKLKSIETLVLTGCSKFEKLAEDLGEMVSLTTLVADHTAITEIPSSIGRLKNLKYLSLPTLVQPTKHIPSWLHGLNTLKTLDLEGCNLTDDAIPKDLVSLFSLEELDLENNCFHRLPSLSGLLKLEVLCLDECTNLRAIPDLPTCLKFLQAVGCTALETMPDFSEMSNMRELYLSDSFKLTDISGLFKSLHSMTQIHMEGCINLTNDFRKNILQGWTSCGYGGIFFNGNYIPEWFEFVREAGPFNFHVPKSITHDFQGLTLCCIYSSNKQLECPLRISVTNETKRTSVFAQITYASVATSCVREDNYLWQGQLSNDVLGLQVGDEFQIFIGPVGAVDNSVRVEQIAVQLVWDKFMKENMDYSHLCLYDFDPHPVRLLGADYNAGPSHDASNENQPSDDDDDDNGGGNDKGDEIKAEPSHDSPDEDRPPKRFRFKSKLDASDEEDDW